jgi:3-hydroxyisobutyrate dehydrogenase-like beta-hydroxyacid dehydrogenase
MLQSGYKVKGFDVIEEKMRQLAPIGLKPSRSPKDAASGVDLIVLSLQTWDIVKDVTLGTKGILASKNPGKIIMDTSTVPPAESRSMAEQLSVKGIDWLDVPISGSSAQLKDGNAVFMAAGKKAVFHKIKPVLEKIGKKAVYVGPNGDGAMLKIVVNTILYLNQAAAIEGFVLGLKAGLNPDVMFEVVSSGAAGSDLISARGLDMLTGNFEPKGALGIKSLDFALENAERLGVILPMASLYRQFMLQAFYNGWGGNDGTAVMTVYEQLAGIKRKKTPPRPIAKRK